MISLVIGNGESRKSLDLRRFENKLTLIGCNAAYRDLSVDHLICFDKRMVEESVRSAIKNIYTRPRHYRDFKKIHKYKQVKLLPEIPYQGKNKQDHPDHWNSGPYALLLASELDNNHIFSVGFDLYDTNGLINNIYKGTKNYAEADSRPVDPTFWIYQIKKIMRCCPEKKFYFFNHRDWIIPETWKACGNFYFFEIEKLYHTVDTVLNTAYNLQTVA